MGGEEGVRREKPRQQPVEKDEAASVGVRATAGKRGNGRNRDTQRQANRREAPCARIGSLGETGGHRAVVDMEDREDTVEWAHRRIGRGWRAREIWACEGDRGGGGTHRWRMIFRDTVAAK
jgi:hypothetical protein